MTAASYVARPAGVRSFWLGFAAYLVPSFPIAFVWHLVLFEQKYHALQIYRDEPVIAFGLGSMIIQGAIFSWLFPRVFAQGSGSVPEGRALVWPWRRPAVVVVHHTRGRSQECDGFRAGLCVARNHVHDPAVRGRGSVDRPRLPKMMRRN